MHAGKPFLEEEPEKKIKLMAGIKENTDFCHYYLYFKHSHYFHIVEKKPCKFNSDNVTLSTIKRSAVLLVHMALL